MENDSKSTLRQTFVAPECGTAAIATNIVLSITDFDAIKHLFLLRKVEMVVVGPEDPLVESMTFLMKKLSHIPVIGPSKIETQLEGSKIC
jgi:phosphoribosylamine--glycine ligase